MFATLLGGLPRPPDAVDLDAAVLAVVAAQEAAGLEPITDGRLRAPGFTDVAAGDPATGRPTWREPVTVAAWRFAAGATSRLVKQALPGPYTLGRRLPGQDHETRQERTAAWVDVLRHEIEALAEAGCPLVEIEEPDAVAIGADEVERRRFREAHELLLDGIDQRTIHLSLAVTGGSADTAGIETILAAPYPSLAVDLIDGPDNWRLVRATPGDRGIILGALSTLEGSDDGPELLLWAVGYAASSNGRGTDRVGLATAGSLAALPWAVAERKMRRLGEAARIASLPKAEAAAAVDARALDLRSAAAGRYVPRRTRRSRPSRGG